MNRRKAVRALFLLVALGFGVWAVASQWTAVADGFARLSWAELAGSLVAVLGALLSGMLMWRALLTDLGSPLAFTDASKIFFVGQLGKYIPGSVWPMLAQMEMGRDHGIPRPRSAAAFFLTYPIYLGTGLLVAVVTLPVLAGSRSRDTPGCCCSCPWSPPPCIRRWSTASSRSGCAHCAARRSNGRSPGAACSSRAAGPWRAGRRTACTWR